MQRHHRPCSVVDHLVHVVEQVRRFPMQENRVGTTGGTSTRRVYGGLYNDPAAAERGIRRFRDAGYEGERIGIISRDREDAKDVAEHTGASAATGAATGAWPGACWAA